MTTNNTKKSAISGKKTESKAKLPAKSKLASKSKLTPKSKPESKSKPALKSKAELKPAPESTLKVGDLAPAFTLLCDDGTTVSSKDLKGKAVVIYFYPKDMTPGCTTESCDFRDLFPKFKKQGVLIFGVSKDSVASHVKFKAKYSLPFPLLADVDGKMCEAYGVWKEKSMYGRKYMGIERSTFVINPEGKISAVYPSVKVTKHVETVLAGILT